MEDRFDLLDEPAGLQVAEDGRPRRLDLHARIRARHGRHAAPLVDRLHGFELEVSEQPDVDDVPVRADHRRPAPEIDPRLGVRPHEGPVPEQRHHRGLPDGRAPPLIVGVDDHGATRGKELGPRRRDRDGPASLQREPDPRKLRWKLLIHDVRLRQGRLAGDAVEARPFPAVEEALVEQADEDRLAERAVLIGVRAIRVREIRRHPHPFRDSENALPDPRNLLAALCDERLAVPLVEGLRVLLLDRPLDVDPVLVETEREHDGLAEHALRAGDHVDQGVRDDRARVPVTAWVRRGSIDHVRGPSLRRVRVERGLALPCSEELPLELGVPSIRGKLRLGHVRRRLESAGP